MLHPATEVVDLEYDPAGTFDLQGCIGWRLGILHVVHGAANNSLRIRGSASYTADSAVHYILALVY